MSYGLPYMGSKNRIVDFVAAHLPNVRCEHFYDLFAGGCAVTHYLMEQGRFKYYHCNDIVDVPLLFKRAVDGEFRDERRWISREDFFRLKDTDAFVRYCWSFGNKGSSYMYGRTIEPYKRALHYAVLFDDWAELHRLCPEVSRQAEEHLQRFTDTKDRRVEIRRIIVRTLKQIGDASLLDKNPLYNSCHRKDGRQSLERLQRLGITQGDYQDVKIETDAVIYCDIPYKGTGKYNKTTFDHERFYQWALRQQQPVLISEYEMPRDFYMVAEIKKLVSMCASKSSMYTERLFCPRKQAKLYYKEPIQLTLF